MAPQLDAREQAPPPPPQAYTHIRTRARAHSTRARAHTREPPNRIRTRARTLPRTTEQEDKDRLWAEADYFGLPGLCDLLMGCGFARALTEDDVRMRAAEETQPRTVA